MTCGGNDIVQCLFDGGDGGRLRLRLLCWWRCTGAELRALYPLTKRLQPWCTATSQDRLIEDLAGVRPHLGKTRCWGEGATDPPPGFEDMDAARLRVLAKGTVHPPCIKVPCIHDLLKDHA